MTKNILFTLVLLICTLVSLAQQPTQPPAQSPQPQQTISPEDRTKMFVDHIAPKLSLSKGQKDTLTRIFLQYTDDIQKYHAENNAKVIAFMMKTRDDKVKKLLRDSLKFEKYVLVLEDIQKQSDPHNQTSQPQHEGGHHNRSGGMGGGGPGGNGRGY